MSNQLVISNDPVGSQNSFEILGESEIGGYEEEVANDSKNNCVSPLGNPKESTEKENTKKGKDSNWSGSNSNFSSTKDQILNTILKEFHQGISEIGSPFCRKKSKDLGSEGEVCASNHTSDIIENHCKEISIFSLNGTEVHREKELNENKRNSNTVRKSSKLSSTNQYNCASAINNQSQKRKKDIGSQLSVKSGHESAGCGSKKVLKLLENEFEECLKNGDIPMPRKPKHQNAIVLDSNRRLSSGQKQSGLKRCDTSVSVKRNDLVMCDSTVANGSGQLKIVIKNNKVGNYEVASNTTTTESPVSLSSIHNSAIKRKIKSSVQNPLNAKRHLSFHSTSSATSKSKQLGHNSEINTHSNISKSTKTPNSLHSDKSVQKRSVVGALRASSIRRRKTCRPIISSTSSDEGPDEKKHCDETQCSIPTSLKSVCKKAMDVSSETKRKEHTNSYTTKPSLGVSPSEKELEGNREQLIHPSSTKYGVVKRCLRVPEKKNRQPEKVSTISSSTAGTFMQKELDDNKHNSVQSLQSICKNGINDSLQQSELKKKEHKNSCILSPTNRNCPNEKEIKLHEHAVRIFPKPVQNNGISSSLQISETTKKEQRKILPNSSNSLHFYNQKGSANVKRCPETAVKSTEIFQFVLQPNNAKSINELKQKLSAVVFNPRFSPAVSMKPNLSNNTNKCTVKENYASPIISSERKPESRPKYQAIPEKPRVVVEKSPMIGISLTDVSALKDSEDDDNDSDGNPHISESGSNQSPSSGTMEHRKRFCISSEAPKKWYKNLKEPESPIEHDLSISDEDKESDSNCDDVETEIVISGASDDGDVLKNESLKNTQHRNSNEHGLEDKPKCPISVTPNPAIRLSDIPSIASNIDKVPPNLLPILHSILFNAHGSCNSKSDMFRTKRNILHFKGFPFKKNSVNYEMIRRRLQQLHFQVLIDIACIFFGPYVVEDVDLIEKILYFLSKPTKNPTLPVQKKNEANVSPAKKKLNKLDKLFQYNKKYESLKNKILQGKAPVLKVRLKRLRPDEIMPYLRHRRNAETTRSEGQNHFQDRWITSAKVRDKRYSSDKEMTPKEEPKADAVTEKNSFKSAVQLKSFPDVAADIEKADEKVISLIHVLLFGKDGEISTQRKRILEFGGFSAMHKYDFKNRKKFLKMIALSDLKKVCQVLHLKFDGQTKEDVINCLLHFIKVPCEVFLQTSKKPPNKVGRPRLVSNRLPVKEFSFSKKQDSSLSPSISPPSNASDCKPTEGKPVENTATAAVTNDSTVVQPLSGPAPNPESDSSVAVAVLRSEKPLESFETIRFNIECATPDDLSELYDILFVKPCDSFEIHQKILQFKGFDFGSESTEFHFRKTLLSYMTFDCVKKIAKFLDLIDDYSHMHKNDLADRILKFLMEPKEMKNSNSSTSPIKRTHIVRLGEKIEMPPSNSFSNDSQMHLQALKFKHEASASTGSPPDPYHPIRKYSAEVSSSSDDEADSNIPLVAFVNHPSDSRLKKDIREIIHSKLLSLTMKDLIIAVYAKYPEFDIRYRSNFIKSKARQILSNMQGT